MALSNAELTRKTSNLAETPGYGQDGVDALRVEVKRQGRGIRRLELDVVEVKTDVAEVKAGVVEVKAAVVEVLRRLPQAA